MDTDISKNLDDVKKWLTGEFAGIRSGQASPAILDSVKVESYGTLAPLNQVGSVGIEDARTLRVSVWDASQIAAVESAVSDANLGVSVSTDSAGLRVVFPELTTERRGQLMKLAKAKQEEARIRVRHVRDDIMKVVEKAEKDGDISEDEKFTHKEKIQKDIEAMNATLDTLFAKKEAELKI